MEGREPCPYRIVDDVGGAFCMGSIGGGIWHYFKGVRNAPKGERLRGGISSVKARAPIVGGTYQWDVGEGNEWGKGPKLKGTRHTTCVSFHMPPSLTHLPTP